MTDKNEVDFAMDYAAERKMRMGLQVRLFALMYETVPYMKATKAMIRGIVTKDPSTVTKSMRLLTAWEADIDINMLLNILKPAADYVEFTDDELRAMRSIDDLGDDRIGGMQETAKNCAADMIEEYCEFAHEFNFPCTHDLRRKNIEELVELTKKYCEDHNIPTDKIAEFVVDVDFEKEKAHL